MKAMRNLLLTAALICVSLPMTLAKGEPASADAQLRQKVVSLMRNVDLSPMEDYEQDATIKFLVTSQNEIVVLSVHTASTFLDQCIKDRLNYRHVNVHGVKKMRPYTLSVRFVKD